MGIFKKLFGDINNSSNKAETEPDSRTVNISINRIEKPEAELERVYFDFEGYSNDLFAIDVKKDSFDESKEIKAHAIHSRISDKIITFADELSAFYIGLSAKNDQLFLTLAAYRKELKINSGDQFYLLFEDDEKFKFDISKNGYKIDSDEDGVIVETIIPIADSLLDTMVSKNAIKWRYDDIKNDRKFSDTFRDSDKQNIIELSRMIKLILTEKYT